MEAKSITYLHLQLDSTAQGIIVEKSAERQLVADIAGSIEEANTLSTNLTTDATLLEKLFLFGNETFLEQVVVSENAVRILTNILNE